MQFGPIHHLANQPTTKNTENMQKKTTFFSVVATGSNPLPHSILLSAKHNNFGFFPFLSFRLSSLYVTRKLSFFAIGGGFGIKRVVATPMNMVVFTVKHKVLVLHPYLH